MDRRAQLERSLKGLDTPKKKEGFEIGMKSKKGLIPPEGSVWKDHTNWVIFRKGDHLYSFDNTWKSGTIEAFIKFNVAWPREGWVLISFDAEEYKREHKL